MVDLNRLATSLEGYSSVLAKHEASVRADFDQLKRQLARLSAVYEGTAATEFKEHFAATERSLDDYVEGTARIQKLVAARTERLREADRRSGL